MIKEERQEGELKAEAKAEVIVNQRQKKREIVDHAGAQLIMEEKQRGRSREGEA